MLYDGEEYTVDNFMEFNLDPDEFMYMEFYSNNRVILSSEGETEDGVYIVKGNELSIISSNGAEETAEIDGNQIIITYNEDKYIFEKNKF